MSLGRTCPHVSPRLEPLEDRIALSWSRVPPASIPRPAALALTLNSNAGAAGTAGITRNEIDYYTFIAPRSGNYRFTALTPTSALDTVLAVFGGTGTRLAFNDDVALGNTDSQVNVSLSAGQRYYFGITNYTGTRGGAYTWRVQGPAAPVDDAWENNDTITQASNLGTLITTRTLTDLVLADGADWFRFSMPGPGTNDDHVALSFRHVQGDLDLQLYDSTGHLIRYSEGRGDGERVSLEGLPAGTYSVLVRGFQGATNPSYSLEIDPGVPLAGATGSHFLYLNFDGATLRHSDLVRWAGTDWANSVRLLDAEGDGITVRRFLDGRADREQVITRMVQLLRDDLRPFGIEVVRHSGLAVEGVGATTVFLGAATLSNGYIHVASQVDRGNNNRTDIAFVGNETWDTTEQTALALADVTLHEAGHTWGLWHVDSGASTETMGLRYSVGDYTRWAVNTSFLDRSFAAHVGKNGTAAGPGPQNSYQVLRSTFGGGLASALTTASVLVDTSTAGIFTLTTTSPGIDRVRILRLASGNLQVRINGRIYELVRGYREVRVYTSGDRRDRVEIYNNLGGVRVSVHRQAGATLLTQTKHDEAQAALWAGLMSEDDSHNLPCACPLCRAGTGIG